MGPRAPRPCLKLRCTQAVFSDTLRLPSPLHSAVPRVFCLGHGEESLRTIDGAGTVCVASPGKIRATQGGGERGFSRVLWYALAAGAERQQNCVVSKGRWPCYTVL
ncbi:hypothetical protein CapIbe_017749 [Capra ibex]